MPARPPDHTLPSVLLFPVEGPPLKREDLEMVIKEMGAAGHVGSSGYVGIGEFRYRNGPDDFDVFLLVSPETMRIEFRHPREQD